MVVATRSGAATISDLVARHAVAGAWRTALVWQGGSVSYGALVDRAARLANSLVRRGVREADSVGLCGKMSADLVVGLLGVMRAGAAYVPLSPDDPAAHRDHVIADSGCRVVVASRADAELLRGSDVEVVLLDGDHSADGIAPAPRLRGDHLAYVMYTSGSTGQPKGVRIEHRSIVNLVSGGFAPTGVGQTYCAIAPPTFDAATFEIWGALCNGGTLVVPPPGLLDPYRIADLVARHRISVLHLTKGLFNVVVDDAVDGLAGVTRLMTGGDVLSPPHVRAALRSLPGTTVSNCYGPTEATTFTTIHQEITEADTEGQIPIGRPIPGAYVRVLDGDLRPVPDGEVGELFIGGAGLARGYTDHHLTVERFLPDPLAQGARVYRTGDTVRRRPDGVLEFLGRFDNQVKIRGFRVELDAVEMALLETPGVRQACCLTHTDPTGEKWLTGYVVFDNGGTVAAVREHLRRVLPPYMNPTWFVELPSLPLKSNGKIDRRSLPTPNPTVH
ncbi:amino acid adenylation domain-containing protein [Umezawaea endophytica]|uniref:Amino acid adenylation domain-containing protein n=1 Tax=Umezawaea endophytica TaxID=1654476 RepID=A0A9X2VT58_9PSEU|nr:amino acid adenylation domain-containing protein [Umezawaea endophytica]MCS7482451.1 amino acid adenylation domain-containing protein [Umezawaea endophytica]